MKRSIKLKPVKKVNGTINLPGSKSISNRALLLAAQAQGITKLTNLLDSDDVRYMLNALQKLGITYYLSSDCKTCEIQGIGGALHKTLRDNLLFLGNSGTSMRFLTAALCLQNNKIILTGEPRMQERPIGHLVNALRQGGSKIEYLQRKNYPPIQVFGGYTGGSIIINGSISSQFLSAILMMAPLADNDSYIDVKGILVSKPYINTTISIMQQFGVEINHKDYRYFYVRGKRYYRSPGKYEIEGDASSASYFLAAAAICGGPVKVIGINKNSIQGDIHFANILQRMGAIINWGSNYIECIRGTLNSVDIDMNSTPDIAMTVAVTALFTKTGTTTLRNIYNWRIKETDRLKAMANELRKVGAIVFEGSDYLSLTPPSKITYAEINTYNDHRMAMCFALLALSESGVTIIEPECVNKTFPCFFEEYSKLIS
ncbi:3-phosphoshikimate 1-carboxyvinyltransferase [Blochmannia endosymbiont of Camponotus (Colobopsis) obliquus]|uniref:3-phosphoshikimate 1-carboxyvinyltransferase n=1 Tax=Blochmannia endosymbiont of Camponotus (Colobopsis) obliquus TaxID=1505597 RepID=UPI00061A87CD|nr:3-phosphoshikimate 1-carboxyvinyltransferase [Blochmannia endosymbiont of Camponotus (Colobopsis) obliquus]AKC60541.1 3-phosphoshikimate 1-carboxyvinyltransferase [Blochmannia endosymbiont of Camponotus (Colobopsis) obliquus]